MFTNRRSRLSRLTLTVSLILLFFLLIILWTADLSEYDEDPLTVVIEYDCREVLKNQKDIPLSVVKECSMLLQEYQEKFISDV